MRAPPLPQVGLDLALEAFTHVSLRRHVDGAKAGYVDNERLAVLGATVLDFAITKTLIDRRPLLTASEVAVRTHVPLPLIGAHAIF